MNTKRGFSLLELLVSISIIAVLGTVISQVLFTTLRTNTKTEILKEVKQNGDIALETIQRLIQGARSVSSTCSDTGTTATSLAIVDRNGETITFSCVLDGTATRIASTSASGTEYLTNKTVTLGETCVGTSLQFVCTGGGSAPPSIQISFQLTQTGTPGAQYEQGQIQFQSSVSLRNTIE